MPPSARVCAIGEDRLFYLHRRVDRDARFLPFLTAGDPERFFAALRAAGYTHVMYVPPEMRVASTPAPPLSRSREEEFVAAFAALPAVYIEEPSTAALRSLQAGGAPR